MEQYDFTKKDIVNSLKEIGLKEADSIFIHSNLGFFGRLQNIDSSGDYCKIFKDAIFDVIGKNGTLVVPTFTYSFCNNENFDLQNSPSICGMFTEWIRTNTKCIRSEDANYSIAAIGAKDDFFTKNPPSHSFGENSFWERFMIENGKFCNFNFDPASTFVHYVEKSLQVPYRFDKEFSGIFINNNVKFSKSFYHYVRELKPEFEPQFDKFNLAANKKNLVKVSNLGKGQIVCISALDSFNLIKNELKTDPFFLTKGMDV